MGSKTIAVSHSGYIDIDVDIPIATALPKIDTADLLSELDRRGVRAAAVPVSATERNDVADYFDGWAEELRHAALTGDWRHFDVLLHRMRPRGPAGGPVKVLLT